MTDTQTNATKTIDQYKFTILLEQLKTLFERGAISRTEADKTAQRIALENELSPIYLW